MILYSLGLGGAIIFGGLVGFFFRCVFLIKDRKTDPPTPPGGSASLSRAEGVQRRRVRSHSPNRAPYRPNRLIERRSDPEG